MSRCKLPLRWGNGTLLWYPFLFPRATLARRPGRIQLNIRNTHRLDIQPLHSYCLPHFLNEEPPPPPTFHYSVIPAPGPDWNEWRRPVAAYPLIQATRHFLLL